MINTIVKRVGIKVEMVNVLSLKCIIEKLAKMLSGFFLKYIKKIEQYDA